MVELYVAVSPDTGEEYVTSDRSELVNMLARGYKEKDPFEAPASAQRPASPPPQPRPEPAATRDSDSDTPTRDK